MASKGGQKTLKRIAASKAKFLERKGLKWTIKASPGPHNEKESVALGFVLRDLLKVASNLKEAKIILNAGKLSVDGIQRKSVSFPVGLFDVVLFAETKKAYRIVLDNKGRLEAREIKFAEKQHKVSKIVGKKMLKTSTVQLVCNDGKTFTATEKDALAKAKIGDSVLLELPKKVVKVLELKKGNSAFVVGGKHVGETAKILGVGVSAMQRPKLITLESGEENFVTVAKNVFVIGEAKSAIEF